ncbi:hypothetical protein ACIQGZ_16375 [Streptomyces sp. NPDC092296]|uniref:hypothetical protein n=1 Tax=Streptomyces sp. NPDC092296 TaxID=3366012 RepID=UPI00381A11BC
MVRDPRGLQGLPGPLAVAIRGEVTTVDAAGTQHRAVALVVPPMVRRRMLATPHLLTFFIEPHCAYADRLREHCGHGITAAPELRDLSETMSVPPAPAHRPGSTGARWRR